MMLEVFVSSFILIFLSELGDKTHLYSFNIGLQTSKKIAFPAIGLAIFFIMAVGAIAGRSVYQFFNFRFIRYMVAVIFLLVGIFFLLGKDFVKSIGSKPRKFWNIFSGFVLSELGDKSQIVVFGLSAKYKNFLFVWLGASLAEVIVNSISLFAGYFLQKKIKLNFNLISGILFILIGLFSVFESLREVVHG